MYGYDLNLTSSAVATVRYNTELPIIAKLAPNVPDIAAVADAAVNGGADALTICNTMPAMDIDIKSGKPVLGNIYGGLSGPSLRPIALRLVHETAQHFKKKGISIPIIGVGGISKVEHALKYFIAGASAIQIGTANWVDPDVSWRVLNDLEQYLASMNICNINELQKQYESNK